MHNGCPGGFTRPLLIQKAQKDHPLIGTIQKKCPNPTILATPFYGRWVSLIEEKHHMTQYGTILCMEKGNTT